MSSSHPSNILINLNAHMGDHAEAKCIAVNSLRPELIAVGANDPYVRVYDRRMLACRSMKLPGDPNTRYSCSLRIIIPLFDVEDIFQIKHHLGNMSVYAIHQV